jgi:site-specific recombinase XerD
MKLSDCGPDESPEACAHVRKEARKQAEATIANHLYEAGLIVLRHGCGYALANAGHDTRALQAGLGHKNVQQTVRYTELAPDRFKNFWR